MRNDAVLNLRLPIEVKEALRCAAGKDRRSTSQKAVCILVDWLEANGYLEPASSPPKARR